MTERERYRTRGFYYLITDDYQACVKEYGNLITQVFRRCLGAQQSLVVFLLPSEHSQPRWKKRGRS